MKINLNRLDEADNLPQKAQVKCKHYRRWSKASNDYHAIDDIFPWNRVNRIISQYLGKSFNDAFSKYCEQVPKYQQKIFLEQFEQRNRSEAEYYIDNNGNIQLSKPINVYRGPYSISSNDFKVESKHKITGHKEKDFKRVYKQIPYLEYNYYTKKCDKLAFKSGEFLYLIYGNNKYKPKPFWERYKAYPEDFEKVIVAGWIKYFTSKNDPRYVKYHSEKRKAYNKNKRENNISKKDWDLILKEGTIAYDKRTADFKRIQEELRKKEEAENLVKIISHGFDPKTSFRHC